MAEDVRAEPFDIPGYRIVRWLGRGGMADVYLAIQLSLGRSVAVKVLASERTPSTETVARFEQEARIIARLDHPHIVGIFDVGRTSTGQLYYTMPHMPNGDLGSRDLKQDQATVLEVTRALCHALAYAHDQGIVHRDVKPENVLFDKLNRPLLADFGIALSNLGPLRVTREGMTLGSVAYMSPEQARGKPLDGRSDIYSLGVVCYECLTGKLPFSGQDSMAVALAHVEEPVPRLPPARLHWQSFIDKAMAKLPDDRFQSASQMLDALEVVEKRMAIITPIAAVATRLSDMPERLERNLNVPVAAKPRSAIAIVILGVCALAAVLAYQFRDQATGPASETVAAENPAAQVEIGYSPDKVPAPALPAVDVPNEVLSPPSAPLAAASMPPVRAPLSAGSLIHDAGGPEIIVVPEQMNYRGKTYTVAHAFGLGRHEVTRGEYAEFVRATGRPDSSCRKPYQPWSAVEHLDWRNPGFAQDDQHPVVCVSWDDASAYAQWLGNRTHHRYRLPSQLEWLHAARSESDKAGACTQGNVSDESNPAVFPWTDRFNCNDGYARTAPVGHFKASALGIFDLTGNVSEWTRDCATREAEGTPCPERIFRGTSWRDGSDRHNLEYSGAVKTDMGYTTVGIRVMRELEAADVAAGQAIR
jgi:Sulfatase-modifying factor enzyme 1/Protein kinase domain